MRVISRKSTFTLARGEDIGNGLAVVRIFHELEAIKNSWCIIDVASGLTAGVTHQSSKVKAMEKYAELSCTAKWKSDVQRARSGGSYKTRCQELENEMKIWRQSGYVF